LALTVTVLGEAAEMEFTNTLYRKRV